MNSRVCYRLKLKNQHPTEKGPPRLDFGSHCVCCDAGGCSKVQVSYLETSTYSISVPVCPACKGHVKTHYNLIERILLALGGGAIMVLVMGLMIPTARGILPWSAIGLPAAAMLAYQFLVLPRLGGPGHHPGIQFSHRGKGITIRSCNQEVIERLMLQGIRQDWKVDVKPPFAIWKHD